MSSRRFNHLFVFDFTNLQFVQYLAAISFYIPISISAACRPKAKHAVPAPWNARPLPQSTATVQQAAAQGGGGIAWTVDSDPRRSSRVESTRPQSKIQSSSTLRCCDPLPALLAGAAGVVCPTAGSRTGRALSRAPHLDPYALKAVGILSVPDTTTPAFLNG